MREDVPLVLLAAALGLLVAAVLATGRLIRQAAAAGLRLGPLAPAAVPLAFRWLGRGAFHRARVVEGGHARLERLPWLSFPVEGVRPEAAPGDLVFLAWSDGRLLAWWPPRGLQL